MTPLAIWSVLLVAAATENNNQSDNNNPDIAVVKHIAKAVHFYPPFGLGNPTFSVCIVRPNVHKLFPLPFASTQPF